MVPPLTRKEVCSIYRIHRSTLHRWECDGLPIVGGRIAESALVFWLEQRDAARALGLSVREFFRHSPAVREKLLEAALLARET